MQLFTALARVAEQRICKFTAQGLANTSWAFAMMAQLDAHLFMALSRASEPCVGDVMEKQLSMTLWD